MSSTNIYEKKVFIGNKLVNIMVTDPTSTEDEQLVTNSLMNSLAAVIFVYNPYEDPQKEHLREWNNLLSHYIKNPHVSVTVVANCFNVKQKDPQETQGTNEWAEAYNGRVIEIYDEGSPEAIQSIFMGAAEQVCKYIDEIRWGEEIHNKLGGLEKYGIKISKHKDGAVPVPDVNQKGP